MDGLGAWPRSRTAGARPPPGDKKRKRRLGLKGAIASRKPPGMDPTFSPNLAPSRPSGPTQDPPQSSDGALRGLTGRAHPERTRPGSGSSQDPAIVPQRLRDIKVDKFSYDMELRLRLVLTPRHKRSILRASARTRETSKPVGTTTAGRRRQGDARRAPVTGPAAVDDIRDHDREPQLPEIGWSARGFFSKGGRRCDY
jgi:hypothetical protein